MQSDNFNNRRPFRFRTNSPRYTKGNDVVQPRRHSLQHPARRKIEPIPPKPCYVLQRGLPLTYDAEAKMLFFDKAQQPEHFPSRKRAKIAIYWTVQALAEADHLDPAALFLEFTIANA